MGECKTSITLKSIQRIYSINESSINFWVETNIIVCAIMMMINERKRGTRTGIKLGGIKMGIYLKDIRAHVDVGLNIKHTLK